MDLKILFETIIVVITVCGAIYGMMTFLLKGIYAKLDLIDSHIKEIKDDNKRMDQRVTETNKRMDGVYHLLLRRLEPKTDP